MRVTNHNGRANRKGKVYNVKHNDRNYDIKKADNINSDMTSSNYYWHLYNDEQPSLTFEQAELKVYNDLFGKQLEQTNKNYINNRHPERVKDMEQWKSTKNHAPEEVIRQIGNIDESIDDYKFMLIESDYEKKLDTWNKEHNNPFIVLSRACHFDETTTHCHERRIWCYTDERSNSLKIGQEKALKMAGVELPNPNEKEGRYNNRKMTFDKMCREMWIESCEKYGLKIEKEPIPEAKHNMTKEEMIREKNKQLIEQNKEIDSKNKKLSKENKDIDSKNKELIKQNKELSKRNNELQEELKSKEKIMEKSIKLYTINHLTEIKEKANNNYLMGFLNRIFEKLMESLGIKKETEKDNFWNKELDEYDNEYIENEENIVKKDDESEGAEM